MSSSVRAIQRNFFRLPHRLPDIGGTLGLVVCVCVMLLATTARDLWRVYDNNVEQAQTATATVTRLVAEQVDTTLQTADSIVASLVERVEVDGLDPASRNRLYRIMTSLAAALPAIHEMGITDRDGNAVVKSLVPNPTGLNYAERGYFKFHATHSERGPFVGARIKSKIDGSYNVTVTRRVDAADGSFAGTVVTSVSMQAFQRLFDQMQARSGGVIALLSEDGTILARSPSLPNGDGLSGGAGLGKLLGQSSEPTPFSDMIGIDGRTRLGSYQHLDRFPMTVVVSQSTWDVQRSWRQELLSHLCILFGVTIVLFVLGGREMKARRALAALAMQDGLTGLANRRRFDEALKQELRRAARSGGSLSVVMIDLDHFKAYNDHFGHPGGDECLRAVARVLQSVSRRSSDLAARLGGEEFAVILPQTDGEQARTIGEELRVKVQNLAIPHSPKLGGTVTVSVGIATSVPSSATHGMADLIDRADAALYRSKAHGRNVVVLA